MRIVQCGVAIPTIAEETCGKSLVLTNDLEIANQNNGYTFENHLGKSTIDLTLHRNIPIEDWTNTHMQFGSDHYMITFCLPCSPSVNHKMVQNVASTDWNLFRDVLPPLEVSEILTTSQLELRAGTFVNNIKEAYNRACPPKRAFPTRPCKWWNDELGGLLRKKNIAAKEARRYEGRLRGVIARNKKIALGRLFNKALKKAKSESWQKFVSNLEGARNVASVFKSMGRRESVCMPLLKKDHNSWAKSAEENLEILRKSHFKNSSRNYAVNRGDDVPVTEDLPSGLDEFLSWEMIKKAIDELPMGKAPGPDGIRNEAIVKLPEEYQRELLVQCRFSIKSSYIPTSWLDINTIYIKKSGKPNQDCPRTYRPIGLSSCFLKLCERLVNWRLKHTVLNNGIPKQHAFTVNRSTESAISQVVHALEKAKCNGLMACLLSIDIQGAFDTVPFDSIRDALIDHGAEEHIWRWADFLSRNRVMITTYSGSILKYRPNEGTTQGGLNGPDFWIVFLWNIIVIRAMQMTHSLKFADDLSALLIGHDLSSMHGLMQVCLIEFNDWFTDRGLKISASKSTCLIVNKPLRRALPLPLKLGHETVPYVKEVKYLGITIDCSLSWKPHIRSRIIKAKRDLMYARRLIGEQWGLAPEKILWIYTAIVRPTLDYSCQVWACSETWPVWLEAELRKLQRLALLCTTKAQKSTPTKAIDENPQCPPPPTPTPQEKGSMHGCSYSECY